MAAIQKNIVWHPGEVSQEMRTKRFGYPGLALWFTGLSGSGKSSIAVALERVLVENGYVAYRLDGDNIRHGINHDLDFSPQGRKENIRRVAEIVKLFTDANVITLSAFVSPYREDRKQARERIGTHKFIEIYVKASLETCQARDPKALYKKAASGQIQDFTGIQSPYEAPENPELIVDTDTQSLDTCCTQVLNYLQNKHHILVP